VKVLSIEGNRIKLSRKAVLREQRAKLGLPEAGEDGGQGGGGRGGRQSEAAAPAYAAPVEDDDEEVLVEGGEEFPVEEGEDENGEDAPGDEPNFNRADGVPVPAGNTGGRGAWRARRIARTGWRGRRSQAGRSASSRRKASRWRRRWIAGRRRKPLSRLMEW